MPDPIFSELYRDTENLAWAPTDQVRRRGRQRTRRSRIAAGLASAVAVAVVATGAAALAGRPDASPPMPPATNVPTPSIVPSPTVEPSPTSEESHTGTPPTSSPTTSRPSRDSGDVAVPAAALLQTSDLPSGYRSAGTDLDGDWSLDAAATRCSNGAPPLTVREKAERGVVFRAAGDQAIIERVRRYSAADAEAMVDRARRTATRCQPYQPGDSLSVLDSGFAGEEALLIGSTATGSPSRWLIVRQGDLVAEVWLKSATGDAEARRLALRTATRLCAGTDAC